MMIDVPTPALERPAALRIRWRIFSFLFLFGFIAYVQQKTITVAAASMMPDLGLTQEQIGWLEQAFVLGYAIFQMPGGLFGQRLGARRVFVIIGLTAFFATLATPLVPEAGHHGGGGALRLLHPASGGAGRWRGGDGGVRRIRFLEPLTAAILSDGRLHGAFGMAGGGAGERGGNSIERADGRVERLGAAGQAEMGSGDVFVISTPGGGGYGIESIIGDKQHWVKQAMSDAAPSVIDLDIRERIAFLTFLRPEAANTINLPFARQLLSAAFAIEASDARAVVLSGQGKNFCFGGDLKAMVASGRDAQPYFSEVTANLHAAMVHLARLDAPVIAAVNGTAAGAGMGLVLAADYAMASRGSKFVAAYTAVGLTPDATSTFLLPRAVGYKRAMELLLTNRVLDAGEALEWGLVNEVVDDDKLADAAAALAARFAAGPVGAFGAVKRLLADSEPGLEAQLGREARCIARLGAGEEAREGIAAFLEKRAPRF